MLNAGRGILLRQIDRLFGDGTIAGLADGQLLERYLATGDQTAFEALIDRHGPMVLGLCRRMLRDPRDIEDAFQATFLVLVRTGRAIRDRSLVSTWLYRVAYRVARQVRTDTLRRRSCEIHIAQLEVPVDHETSDMEELGPLVDQELNRLPEKYRAPLVLCYLHGRTHDQAAEVLRCPVGTVRSRLARGRDLLKKRLTRRGYAPAHAIVGPGPFLPARLLTEAVPPAMASATVKLALGSGSLQTVGASAAAASALALAQGALTTMKLAHLKWVAVPLLAAGLAAGGALAVSYGAARLSPAATNQTVATAAPAAAGIAPDSRHQAILDQITRLESELVKANALLETLGRRQKAYDRIEGEFYKDPDVVALKDVVAQARERLRQTESTAKSNISDLAVDASRKALDDLRERWSELWEEKYLKLLNPLERAESIFPADESEAIVDVKRKIEALKKQRNNWFALLETVTNDGLGSAEEVFEKLVDEQIKTSPASFRAVPPVFLKGWGQPIDPDGDCSFDLENRRLTIKVPGKGHGLEAEVNALNAPRVLREIEGDFIADLEVEGAFKPRGPSANPNGFPFVGAGLLLWSDDGNYIRLERAAIVRDEHLLNPAGGAGGQDEQLVPYILFQERRDRRVVPPDPGVPVPDGPIFLRLERKKDQIMAAVSVDGHGWRAFPPRTVRLPAKLKLGVAAISSSSEPFTVTLTNFRVLRPD
jgi:RNA polymerase sigma factor (sigma-70 family)